MASSKHNMDTRQARSSFLAMISASMFSLDRLDYDMQKNRFPQHPPIPYEVDASTKILNFERGSRFRTKSKLIPLFCFKIRYHTFKPIFAWDGNTISSVGFAPDIAFVRWAKNGLPKGSISAT